MGDFSGEAWQYEETARIIRSVSPRPGAPSICGVHGAGEALPQEPTRPLLSARAARQEGSCLTGRVLERITKRILGGSDGNEQLTAIVATLLLVLLAVEGATLLNMRSLLTVHAFVGVLLIPVVAVKLASTGWRMLRYYLGADEYVRRGPPHVFLRTIVAPVVVASTIVLFGSGVGLLVLGQREGALVGLHKASFLVWFGATTVHVLTRMFRLPHAIRRPSPGLALRLGLVGASLVTGLALATVSLPAVDHLQDSVSAHIGVDPH